MCQTTLIQESIIRIGTDSYRQRLEAAGGKGLVLDGLIELNESLSSFYNVVDGQRADITVNEYSRFSEQLGIFLSTIEELCRYCDQLMPGEVLSKEIKSLHRNYSALYELKADLDRMFKPYADDQQFNQLLSAVSDSMLSI